MKVFLGGTCNNSTWRDKLMPLIQVDYFNPVVEDWNEECQANEEDEKDNKCNIHLYIITKEMIGVFSIAEAIESVHMDGIVTILHVMPEGFDKGQLKSLDAVIKMVRFHGGVAYASNEIERTARVINNCCGESQEELDKYKNSKGTCQKRWKEGHMHVVCGAALPCPKHGMQFPPTIKKNGRKNIFAKEINRVFDYFDERADAEYVDQETSAIPNEEMTMGIILKDYLRYIQKLVVEDVPHQHQSRLLEMLLIKESL